MDTTTITEFGKNPTLEILIADLEIAALEVSRLQKVEEGDDAEYLASCDRRWAILEAINATPARTLPELKAKARAAEIELERDAADCEGPGSFIEMTRSLIADLKVTEPTVAPLPPVRKADIRAVA
jgi:hypothetical protein